jgi:D-arabinose 1-dehydrogenase-like Zn-dependent alcohol dehydrogenase
MVELMPMSQVNTALQIVKENKARYRIVLVNDA